MRRQPLSYVLWCLGGTALYLWGMHRFQDYVRMRWPETGSDWLAILWFPAIFGLAFLIDRREARNKAEAGIIDVVSAETRKNHLQVGIIGGLVLGGIWIAAIIRVLAY